MRSDQFFFSCDIVFQKERYLEKNTEVFQKGCKRQKLLHKQCNKTFNMNHYFIVNIKMFWCVDSNCALTQNKQTQAKPLV